MDEQEEDSSKAVKGVFSFRSVRKCNIIRIREYLDKDNV